MDGCIKRLRFVVDVTREYKNAVNNAKRQSKEHVARKLEEACNRSDSKAFYKLWNKSYSVNNNNNRPNLKPECFVGSFRKNWTRQ